MSEHDEAPRRLLVADDEEAISSGLALNLRRKGYEVTVVADGGAALAAVRAARQDAGVGSHGFDLVLLDVRMPVLDGFEVCQRLRQEGDFTPILMLTARSQPDDVVYGLKLGADDYVTKPFSVAELIARINAIFRRQARMSSHGGDETFTIGTWLINARKHLMSRGRTSKRLTFYELEVLKLLRERAEETVSRDELLEKVWGVQSSPTSRTVDNFIVKLRRKLEEDQKNPRHILTVYGLGYKLVT